MTVKVGGTYRHLIYRGVVKVISIKRSTVRFEIETGERSWCHIKRFERVYVECKEQPHE